MARPRVDDPDRGLSLTNVATAVLLAISLVRLGRNAVASTASTEVGADPVVPDDPSPATGDVNALGRAQDLVDRTQRRFPPVAFAYGVVKKFGDDRAGRLAALIAYYGFFSIFPLMLVFVTVLGYVLDGHPDLHDDILNSAVAQIPVIGSELSNSGLTGNPLALATGVVAALWAGMGTLLATQDAFNTVWGIPVVERPNFFKSRLRGLLLLAVVATGLVATTVAQSFVSGLAAPGVSRYLLPLVVLLLDVAVMGMVFRVLTDAPLTRREILPGAIVAGTGYWAVQLIGTWYFDRVVKGASDTYGTFAVVIGLLSWFYLLAQVVLFGAETSVVASRGLWPRSLSPRHPTTADREVYEAIAQAQVRPLVEQAEAGGAPQR